MLSHKICSTALICALSAVSLASPAVSQPAEPGKNSLFQKIRPSIVRLTIKGTGPDGVLQDKIGTGFIVSSDGYVLTANHNLLWNNVEDFVGDIEIIAFVSINPGPPSAIEARVRRQNKVADTALLKLEWFPDVTYKQADLCSEPGLEPGNELVAFGYPSGLQLAERRGTFDSPNGDQGFWQTGITATPGMSGGPVVIPDSGKVVGILRGEMGAANSKTTSMIPIQEANDILKIANVQPSDCDRNTRVSYQVQGAGPDFDPPKLNGRTLDGCMITPQNPQGDDCSVQASQTIAARFCKEAGYLSSTTYKAIYVSQFQASYKLTKIVAPDGSWRFVWNEDDGGGYILSHVTCRS